MKSVKVKKVELLTIVKENRLKHEVEYVDSMHEFKTAAVKTLQDQIKKVEEDPNEISIHIPVPISYVKDYDKAIRMLELSVDNEIILDSTEFNQLVQDEWHWKNDFLSNKTLYGQLSRR